MKFSVEIYAKNHSFARLDSYSFGVKKLDEIRKQTGFPDLPIVKVSSYVDSVITTSKSIEITESLARESNLFNDRPVVRLVASNDSLNRFISERVVVKTNTKGDVDVVCIGRFFDEKLFLENWRECGFELEY